MNKHNISDDEIIRDWSFSQTDLALINKFNKEYRLWIASQIGSLKLFGQFLKNPNELASEIIAYICRQVKMPITVTIAIPQRDGTRTEHKKVIFNHLGFSKFNDAQDVLHAWIRNQVDNGIILVDQIVSKAEMFLIENKVAVPTEYKLKREINSIFHNRQEQIYQLIYKQLTPTIINAFDDTLKIIDNKNYSWFQKFKEYPSSATITLLQDYLQRYEKISEVDLTQIDLSEMPPEFAKYLYKMSRYYDAKAIKRFNPEKRYTMILAFFSEAKKIITDYLIQMHDQYISNICRECRNIHTDKVSSYKSKNEKAIDHIEVVIDYLLKQEDSVTLTPNDLYRETTSKIELSNARDNMRQYKITSKYGYANLLQNRYNSMRRYFSNFIKLPFMVEKGNEEIMNAIELIRRMDAKEINTLPKDTPIGFIDGKIKSSLYNQDNVIKRGLWEMGVSIAIKDCFRSGNIFVPHSNKYVSFWNLVYKENRWEQEKLEAYQQLNLNQDGQAAIDNFVNMFHQTSKQAEKKFGKDGFAEIVNGKLKLRKKDKYEPPQEVERLQGIINSYLPKIKIEQLLIEVDQMTGFSRHFTPMHGQTSRPKNFYKTLIAGILSQATNIGIATMENCTTGITVDMLRYTLETYIHEDAIREGNADIVNQHSVKTLSQVHGDGTFSSSDGQRFAVTASSLLSSFYPRYYGYYEKVVNIYTHTSNQFSVYNTNAISCAPRESLYVLDGLLNNNTILTIKEHTTDTEGYTEHIFALCFLLGIDFMPRIKDLKVQQLYQVDKNTGYGDIDELLTKTVNLDIVIEQWDQMIRVIASLKNQLTPANETIRRLSSGAVSDKLSKAFTNLGRLVKTEYILRYITDAKLRDKVQRQLNKGEHRHALSRWIFFANQGKFQVGDYEEIMNKASCLSLVSNAVLYWNTVKISEIVEQLRANGEVISDSALSHISLLSYKHVIPMGTYFVEEDE